MKRQTVIDAAINEMAQTVKQSFTERAYKLADKLTEDEAQKLGANTATMRFVRTLFCAVAPDVAEYELPCESIRKDVRKAKRINQTRY